MGKKKNEAHGQAPTTGCNIEIKFRGWKGVSKSQDPPSSTRHTLGKAGVPMKILPDLMQNWPGCLQGCQI